MTILQLYLSKGPSIFKKYLSLKTSGVDNWSFSLFIQYLSRTFLQNITSSSDLEFECYFECMYTTTLFPGSIFTDYEALLEVAYTVLTFP